MFHCALGNFTETKALFTAPGRAGGPTTWSASDCPSLPHLHFTSLGGHGPYLARGSGVPVWNMPPWSLAGQQLGPRLTLGRANNLARTSRSGAASVLGIGASLELILAAAALKDSPHARATQLRRRRQTRPAQRRRHEPSEVRHSPPQLQKHVGASSARRCLPLRAQDAATRALRPRACPRALAPSVVPPPASAPPRAHPTTRVCRGLAALGARCSGKINTLCIWGLHMLALMACSWVARRHAAWGAAQSIHVTLNFELFFPTDAIHF